MTAKFLKKRRLDIGLTQAQLAKKMGYLTPQLVSNNERGVSLPPMKTLGKLAKILLVDAATINNLIILDKIDKLNKKLITK